MHTAPAKVKYVSTIVNCNLSLVFKNTQLTPVYSRNIYCWATLKERQFHGDRNGACAIAICTVQVEVELVEDDQPHPSFLVQEWFWRAIPFFLAIGNDVQIKCSSQIKYQRLLRLFSVSPAGFCWSKWHLFQCKIRPAEAKTASQKRFWYWKYLFRHVVSRKNGYF